MRGVRELARAEIAALDLRPPQARSEALWLDANESWEDPAGQTRGLNRYPQPLEAASAALASRYGVAPDSILLTRGSDDAIDALTRVFCRAGADAVQVTPPTFHMYAISARIQDAAVVVTPRAADFSLDNERLVKDWRPAVKLVYVCTPNNPTGGETPAEEVLRLCAALSGKSLVVVDEAYAEFSASPSLARYLPDYPNLVVLRTLSKAWALAAARLGVLLAGPDIQDLVRRILPPYPLAAASLEAAVASLNPQAEAAMRRRVRHVAAEREYLARALATLPEIRQVYPSAANFLLVEFADAARTERQLRRAGIRVRGFTEPMLSGCLRITVGSRPESERVLAVLGEPEVACA